MSAPVRFSTLSGWLGWQERLHPRSIEPGLARIARVAARTGWRPPRCAVITVGGTNGKGSCVALLNAMLTAGGYRVATFTSPHLNDYTERIRVDGLPTSSTSLIVAFERIADALDDDTLTFFEFNTLAALLIFESAAPHVIILEVGMGGRLDAVGIVDADVAIVVSVGLDHMEWLGTDRESIGREKAGIYRSGKPAIYGGDDPPQSLIDAARAVKAPLRLRGRDFQAIEGVAGRWTFEGAIDATGSARLSFAGLPPPALAGVTQVANATTAIAALLELRERLPLNRDAIVAGLARVRLPGRFQLIDDDHVSWILDVAHNPDAARALAANLRNTRRGGRTIAVCGMLADKDVRAVVAELASSVDVWIATTTDGPRGLTDRDLVKRADVAGTEMCPGGTVGESVQLARRLARRGDRIVVFGSFLTVGPALKYLEQRGLDTA